jgi:hypothetical protein
MVTPRKISAGFGNNNGVSVSPTTTKAPSPLRSQTTTGTTTSNDANLATGGRKENVSHFSKNRFAATSAPSTGAAAAAASVVMGGGGDTPASTSTDPTSTQWLFGSHNTANKGNITKISTSQSFCDM